MPLDITRHLTVSLILLLAILPVAGAPAAQDEPEENTRIHVAEWLMLGPIPSPLPAFHDEGKEVFEPSLLLPYRQADIDTFIPALGKSLILPSGAATAWRPVPADTNGASLPPDSARTTIVYLAVYIELERWMKLEIGVRATHPFDATIAGESVAKNEKGSAGGKLGTEKTGTVKLERGKHLLVVKTVFAPGDTLSDWRIDAAVKHTDDSTAAPLLSLTPTRNLTLGDILDTPYVRDIAVSPDGKLVALTVQKSAPPEGQTESWLEIRTVSDGTLVRTIRDVPGMGSVRWAPKGHLISYSMPYNGKGAIRVLDLEGGTARTIVEGIEYLTGYRWGPDASFIVYSITEEPKKDESGAKRLLGIYDRPSREQRKTSIYLSSVPGGVRRRLTAGRHSANIDDIHPDGRSVLISRYYENLDERPYGVDELYRLYLDDNRIELLHRGPWLGRAVWSQAGDRILVTGGPSSFGEIGRNVPEGMIPNEYDGQIYILDPATKEVESLTRDFDPAVLRAFWSLADGRIYVIAEEGSSVNLYRCNPDKKTFTRIDLECDVIRQGGMATEKAVAVVAGSSADHPERIYTVDLKRGTGRTICDFNADRFRHVRLGTVEDWEFTTDEGKTIEGRIHYPPNFDASEIYPCLVYYYGGTSPTERDFGGRYPKNLWAAMGYVVYVLQPSGATGYGQEFSAFHVNDWGKITADEIIEGTKRFLEGHPFVDPERVGCLGASYGGFMTQLILTKTDIFAAAVSHAGISSISSYWGEGYWGYAYNAVAAANSFPWNRPDIYIEQSPLFYADRINTPLLLLHGEQDTNVPPGESEQMYTALKLLGKSVEYIRFAGQNHFILDYKKRSIWSDAIISWFDRWLKDEPGWWNDMYPPLDEEPEETADIGLHRIELGEDRTILMGEVTREKIVEHLHTWDVDYFEYLPDEELLPRIGEYIFNVDITIVLGTWCSDSQREVPRLWRILDDLGYPLSEIKMLAVGSSRFTSDMGIPKNLLTWSDRVKKRYGVERVATIIISKGGKELGRIIETPEESLEKDLLRIITK